MRISINSSPYLVASSFYDEVYARFSRNYRVPFVKSCEVNGGNACMTCQVWYVACHVLYIYAMFHIFMPCFIYLCHDLYIYAMIYIYLCDVLYIYAMFYIFMPCFGNFHENISYNYPFENLLFILNFSGVVRSSVCRVVRSMA